MPFLGNTPANTFVSIAKQTITGNGGTTYTLSYPVTNANEIDVFFNNVRQEPTVAYTASGTTIVFSEAIASTDAVYVIFNGQAVGTIDAPAGAYLPTTGGTVSGQLNVSNKIQIQQDAGSNNRLILRGTTGSSYRWNVDNFGSSNQFRIFRENDSDATSGMVAAQFDSAGRLLLPQQPAFMAYSGTVGTGNIVFGTTRYNVGGHYSTSTGYFTAPISGYYLLGYAALCQNAMDVHIIKNGSQWQVLGRVSASGNSLQGSTIAYLSANDYVNVRITTSGANAYGDGDPWTQFYGYLLG